MCSGASKPSTPEFKDPRLNDKEYKTLAREMGIKKLDKPGELYRVEKKMAKQDEAEYRATLAGLEAKNDANRAADIARAEAQFAEANRIQQEQFAANMKFQEQALNRQLESQMQLQSRAEEMSLRSQVPQFTNNSSNARRVRAKTTGKRLAMQASRGASQLRVPLSINSGSSSPVKLNIGS